MKKIPFKNYVLLVFILLFSTFAFFYLTKWYKGLTRQESIISTIISEIKPSEIDNYIIENPDFVIYISDKKNNNCKDYEKKLKNFLIEKDLTRNVVYIDLEELTGNYFLKMVDKYSDNSKSLNMLDATIIIFENQKIKSILSFSNEDADLSITKAFLKNNEVY